MIVTEEEAKTKWCPEARVESAENVQGSVNRDYGKGYPLNDCLCIASGCMAWRWSRKRFEVYTAADGDMTVTPLGPDLGYCGKAGTPSHA